MAHEFTITIPGKPIAKKRPRFVRRGKFVGAYNCQETEEGRFKWELASQMAGKDPIPSGVPIRLSAVFYMPIPSSTPKKWLSSVGHRHVKKPDLDNLVKFVKDCANGLIWKDDSQVFCVLAFKYYSDNPRTELTVRAGEMAG